MTFFSGVSSSPSEFTESKISGEGVRACCCRDTCGELKPRITLLFLNLRVTRSMMDSITSRFNKRFIVDRKNNNDAGQGKQGMDNVKPVSCNGTRRRCIIRKFVTDGVPRNLLLPNLTVRNLNFIAIISLAGNEDFVNTPGVSKKNFFYYWSNIFTPGCFVLGILPNHPGGIFTS